MEDKRNNPKEFWDELGIKRNWREYILPKRNDEEFWNEGRLEAQNIKKFSVGASFEYVIDYGCGIGRITKNFETDGTIIGIDICDKFVKIAGDGFYTIDKFKKKNVATFIYCISVIQHNDTENRKKIVDHIHFLLKKGGKCLINFPIHGEVHRGGWFVATFKQKELKELFSNFSDIKITKGNLVNYGGRKVKKFNEYFVLATK